MSLLFAALGRPRNVLSLAGYSSQVSGSDIAVPIGARPGDMLVLLMVNENGPGGTSPTPAGWTTVSEQAYGTLATRVMQPGDTSFTTNNMSVIVAVRGSSKTAVVDGWSASAPQTFAGAYPFVPVTSTGNHDFVILAVPSTSYEPLAISGGTVLFTDRSAAYRVSLAVNYDSAPAGPYLGATYTTAGESSAWPCGAFLLMLK